MHRLVYLHFAIIIDSVRYNHTVASTANKSIGTVDTFIPCMMEKSTIANQLIAFWNQMNDSTFVELHPNMMKLENFQRPNVIEASVTRESLHLTLN